MPKMLYQTPGGTFAEILAGAKKVMAAAMHGKDGKIHYHMKAERVTIGGKHYIATQRKPGQIPYLTDASKVQMVSGYMVTIQPKGKASFTKFIPEKDVIYTR